MKEFHRAIFFTKVPLGGYYKYKDKFQIFPCDMENMPYSKRQEHFPNILEFWTTDDEIQKCPIEFEGFQELCDRTATVLTKQDNIYALLSTFTNNLFFRYTDSTGKWGIPILSNMSGKELENMTSSWCLNMYFFPDLPRQYKIDSFTEQKVNEIQRRPHKEFYLNEPNLDFDKEKEIILPSTIDQLFEYYYALNAEKRSYIDTAASYTFSAIELNNSKKTLSLLASFTAMETMVNLEYMDFDAETCKTCNQLKYSVAKKFREYLLNYIGNSVKNKKKFNSYYSLRSKIVHTGKQLKTELLFADIPKDEMDLELLTRLEILQLGKLSIVNWLLANN